MRDRIDLILKHVCDVNNINVKTLKSKNRARNIIDARSMAQFLMRDLLELTLKQIGNEFGLDHSTVLHSTRKHLNMMDWDVRYKNKFNRVSFALMEEFPAYYHGSVMEEMKKEIDSLKGELDQLKGSGDESN